MPILPLHAADTLFSRQQQVPEPKGMFTPPILPEITELRLASGLFAPFLPAPAGSVRRGRHDDRVRASAGKDRQSIRSDALRVAASRETGKDLRPISFSPVLRFPANMLDRSAATFLLRIQRRGIARTPGAEAEADNIDAGALRADLRRRGGPGMAVDIATRQLLKPHLRFDPFMARLHHSPSAAGAARQLRADAFTIGTDVFFGAEQPPANTREGLGLLAHELTHVGQQIGATGGRMRFFTPSGGDEMEREAQQTAQRVTDSLPPPGLLHQGARSIRPSLHFATPPQAQTFETEPPPAQTVTAQQTQDEKPLPSVKRANARAVTARVYELMQQEAALNRMRGGGQRWI